MLSRIGTHYLDVHVACIVLPSYVFPFAPGQLDWIAGIGYYTEPCVQDVGCNAVGEPIAFALYVDRAQVSQRLLDRIDSQVSSTDARCQQLGQCRFSTTRKARKYVERGVIQCRGTLSKDPTCLSMVGQILAGANDSVQVFNPPTLAIGRRCRKSLGPLRFGKSSAINCGDFGQIYLDLSNPKSSISPPLKND